MPWQKFFVGSRVGAWASSARDRFALVREALVQPETVGGTANDHLGLFLIAGLCIEGGVFVDVGAHLGLVVHAALAASAPARLIAIEPVPEKARILARRFPGVEVLAVAVSDRSAQQIAFVVDTIESACSSLAEVASSRPHGTRTIHVPMTTLDLVLAGSPVDIVKIDAEGAELSVLRGATRVLRHCRPTLLFESAKGPHDEAGYSPATLWTLLNDLEYVVLAPNRVAHDDPGMSKDTFLDSHRYPFRCMNYFAIAGERRTEIRDAARRILRI